MNPAGNYVDQLNAAVKSLSNALYLQDSYSPSGLRNLTVTAGVRYEFQTLYDMNGAAFLDARNLGPRLSAVYRSLQRRPFEGVGRLRPLLRGRSARHRGALLRR